MYDICKMTAFLESGKEAAGSGRSWYPWIFCSEITSVVFSWWNTRQMFFLKLIKSHIFSLTIYIPATGSYKSIQLRFQNVFAYFLLSWHTSHVISKCFCMNVLHSEVSFLNTIIFTWWQSAYVCYNRCELYNITNTKAMNKILSQPFQYLALFCGHDVVHSYFTGTASY